MSDENTYQGSCFCGGVTIEVTGTPAGMGYCHCESCRHWSAGPVNAFSLWDPQAVQVTQGEELIESFAKTPASHRKWCRACGGHLMTEHPEMGLIDVYAAILPDLDFEPGVHVHCQESVLAIDDSLTRMRDLPAEMGGSGEEMP